MFPSVQYIHENFKRFNKQMFASLLPPIPVAITTAKNYLGYITFKKGVDKSGKPCFCNYRFRFSARYDMPENEWEDILIHEMIHYFIAYQGLNDNAPHGKLFREKMNEINTKYHRNISISRKNTEVVSTIKDEPQENRRNKKCLHVIAFVRLKDGKSGIKVLPRNIQKVSFFYGHYIHYERVKSIEIYFSTNPFFNKFPNSSKLYINLLDENTIVENLKSASQFEIYKGKLMLKPHVKC